MQQQQHVSGHVAELDVVGLYRDKTQVCIHLLFIRQHKILGNKSYFPTVPNNTSDSDILQAFIAQHYLSNDRSLLK